MADIKQAFLWLSEGKAVRRTGHPQLPAGYQVADSVVADSKGAVRCTCHGKIAIFFALDPLGEDWEIAEPKPPKGGTDEV